MLTPEGGRHMYGYLRLETEQTGRRPVLQYRMLCGLSVLQASVPMPDNLTPRQQERRINRAAEKLWESGVNRILLPKNFSWKACLHKTGLAEVEVESLCRAAAAQLAIEVLLLRGWEPERATVALAGKRIDRAIVRTAELLAQQVSGLRIEVPEGGMELADWLQEEYGLPVLRSDGLRPAFTVSFDEYWKGRGPVLQLWGSHPDLLGAEVWVPGLEIPEECEPMPLLAALLESGMLSEQMLRARGVGNHP